MDDLKKQAEELGIKVDGRWSEDRLRQEIDKVLEAPAEEEPKQEPFGGKGDHNGDGKPGGSVKSKLPVRLLRGYAPLDGGRKLIAGEVVELPAQEARAVVEKRVAERADDF